MTHDELVEENLILKNLGTKESKWLVIHKHCMQKPNKIDQGLGNQLLYISVLSRSVENTKKNVFLSLLSSTNWISRHGKSRRGTSNANGRKISKGFYNRHLQLIAC